MRPVSTYQIILKVSSSSRTIYYSNFVELY